jgi:hypothetical protein
MSEENKVQTIEEVVNAFYPDADAEPLKKAPTEEAEKDDDPAEEEDNSNDDSDDDAEEEASEEQDEEEESSDILVYEINDKEYTAKDIKLLESGNLMQADYTKKTQALAKDRETLDGNVTILNDAITKTNDLSAQLEVLVAEDTEINWAELKEDDPDEYIKLKERADSRKSKLKEVKANNQTTASPQVDVEAERVKIVEAHSEWVEDGKQSVAYKNDMDGLNAFYDAGEWTQDQVNIVNSNAKIFELVLGNVRTKAASDKVEKKKTSAKKKIIASPKSGKAKDKTQTRTAEEIFYGT